MVHQSYHLIGVVAYGLMALAALGAGIFILCRPASNAKVSPRLFALLLFCYVVGIGLWAGDEWRAATEWRPLRPNDHGILHHIGSFLIAIALMINLIISFRAMSEDNDQEKPEAT